MEDTTSIRIRPISLGCLLSSFLKPWNSTWWDLPTALDKRTFAFDISCKNVINIFKDKKVFVRCYTENFKMAEFGPVVVVVAVIALLFNFGVHKVEEGFFFNFQFILYSLYLIQFRLCFNLSYSFLIIFVIWCFLYIQCFQHFL